MNILSNTRKWSTPVIIGSGIFVSISGVLMFYGIHNPIELAHEWIGLLFAAAIFLHVFNHWTSFKKYFSQRTTVAVLGPILIVTASFIFVSATQEGGSGMMKIIRSVEASPLAEVSLILDKSPDAVISNLASSGYSVSNSGQTINEIAQANNTQPKELMGLLFR